MFHIFGERFIVVEHRYRFGRESIFRHAAGVNAREFLCKDADERKDSRLELTFGLAVTPVCT